MGLLTDLVSCKELTVYCLRCLLSLSFRGSPLSYLAFSCQSYWWGSFPMTSFNLSDFFKDLISNLTFVYVHVCRCTQKYVCAWKPEKDIKCLAICHFSPLGQSLPLKLELDLWPASLSNPLVSVLYSFEIIGVCNQVLLFIWVLRSTLNSSCLHNKHVYPHEPFL